MPSMRYLTFWALSTENIRRQKSEIKTLHSLFERALRKLSKDVPKDVSIRFAGKLDLLPKRLVDSAKAIEGQTAGKQLQVIILIGYGGRQEIVDATRRIVQDAKKGKISRIDERVFQRYVYCPDVPNPDLIIRTSERRLSGFLLWQGAYSEIYFCPKLWPDFSKRDLILAIKDFARRQRRFGR